MKTSLNQIVHFPSTFTHAHTPTHTFTQLVFSVSHFWFDSASLWKMLKRSIHDKLCGTKIEIEFSEQLREKNVQIASCARSSLPVIHWAVASNNKEEEEIYFF